MTVRGPVVTALVSVQENVRLKTNAKSLLLSFVLEKVTRTRLVLTGVVQVVIRVRDSLPLNCSVHISKNPFPQISA